MHAVRRLFQSLLGATSAFVCLGNAPLLADNPIKRLARLIDSDLVEVENRIFWLDGILETLAKPNVHSLKTLVGYRGARLSPEAPSPVILLDLGRVYPVSDLYLIPSQQEFQDDPGIFPRKITLECSIDENFTDPLLIYKTTGVREQSSNEAPNKYPVDASARYIRITVDLGLMRDGMEIFGLSEIVVSSGDYPISFGAKIVTRNSLDSEGLWSKQALVDGRCPLGSWESGNPDVPSKGDVISADREKLEASWTVDLQGNHALSHLVLFPYEINRAFGTYILPETMVVELHVADAEPLKIEWVNPSPGGSHLTPLVLPCKGVVAKQIVIHATNPWVMGNQYVLAFSEIEAWSENSNLLTGQRFTRTCRGEHARISSLTDGFTSSQKILPAGAWLDQLERRHTAQKELERLRPVYQSMEERSELNASWGSAVIAGLGSLTPFFLFERRRLTSRKNITQLRSRIASDLHDDIGSNLGSISMIARSARRDLERLNGPEEIANDLIEVESIARESALAMRDIVWLLERRQDSIGDLYHRMRETANRLLRDIEIEIDCRSTQTATKISLDAKRHLFLFYKESIHNVLKHSRASKVRIGLWDEGDQLVMEITDNGIGLQTSHSSEGHSVSKLEDRCGMLRGQLGITSRENQGTSITLRVKRSYLARS